MSDFRAQATCDFEPPMQEQIRSVAAEIFQADIASIDLAMGPDDIDGWDSLNHLRLITEVEKRFSLRLTMQQIQQIHSLQDLADLASERTS